MKVSGQKKKKSGLEKRVVRCIVVLKAQGTRAGGNWPRPPACVPTIDTCIVAVWGSIFPQRVVDEK